MANDKKIPKLEIKNGVLTISISASDLKWITEQNPSNSYKVIDEGQFLKDFTFILDNYATSNGVELGMSNLQLLIDEVVEETYVNGSEAIIDTEDNKNILS